MSFILLIFGLVLSICYGQINPNCESFVGKKMEYTVTDIKEQTQSVCGYVEFFDGGKIESWNSTGGVQTVGNYTFKATDSKLECFLQIKWNDNAPLENECVTFSPTANELGMTGCYVFNDTCVPECNMTVMEKLGSWYAAVVLK
eukprot:527368_1